MKNFSSSNILKNFILSVILGTTFFILTAGISTIQTSNIEWIKHGDLLQHYLGWEFFRKSEWSFPPGLNPNYGIWLSSSIVYSDSIPLAALFFKVFKPFLSEHFQYFGLWIFLCFVLQAFVAIKLIEIVTGNLLIQIIGACFFLLFPPWLWRIGVHTALFSHFFILASIYLNLAKVRHPLLIWCGILIGSVLTHFYIFAICTILFIPFLIKNIRKFLSAPFIIKFLSLAFAISLSMFLSGYFAIDGSSIINKGFGESGYRFNFLSIISPRGWSLSLPNQTLFDFDYESFSYLGLGVFFLCACSIPLIISNNKIYFRVFLEYKSLSFVVIILLIFSLSNNISFGSLTINYPLHELLIQYANIFRVSARFIWPALYLFLIIFLFILIKGYPKRIVVLILVLGLLIQLVDTSAGLSNLRTRISSAKTLRTKTLLKIRFGINLLNTIKKLFFYPFDALKNNMAMQMSLVLRSIMI